MFLTNGGLTYRLHVPMELNHLSFKLASLLFFLGQLCNATPAIATAVEIGCSAEQYVSEGHYQSALDKFESSLGILIPLLTNEPKGRRRDLLYNQIQLWMTQAESTKALLCAADFKNGIVPDNTGKYCC
jgi:hypothetical protein